MKSSNDTELDAIHEELVRVARGGLVGSVLLGPFGLAILIVANAWYFFGSDLTVNPDTPFVYRLLNPPGAIVRDALGIDQTGFGFSAIVWSIPVIVAVTVLLVSSDILNYWKVTLPTLQEHRSIAAQLPDEEELERLTTMLDAEGQPDASNDLIKRSAAQFLSLGGERATPALVKFLRTYPFDHPSIVAAAQSLVAISGEQSHVEIRRRRDAARGRAKRASKEGREDHEANDTASALDSLLKS